MKMAGQPLNVSDIRDRLLADIQLAFRGVQRGDGPTLHEADLEGVGSAEEARAARERDTDSDWQEVPAQVIERLSWALCFVDPQGFRYYVPAYMSFALRHAESDSNSVDFTIYAFDTQPNSALSEFQASRFSQFDDGQARVICRFLRFMAEYAGADEIVAQRALANYWGRFCHTADDRLIQTKREASTLPPVSHE